MANTIAVSTDLKRLEEIFLKANPVFEIIPIRVRMAFDTLSQEELADLKEFANVEDGAVERWLLVPDCLPLGILSHVVDRAFGLLPDPNGCLFSAGEEDWKRLFPTMKEFLSACGSVLDNPIDEGYFQLSTEACVTSSLWIAPLPIAMMIPSSRTYRECQKIMADEVAELRASGVLYNGRNVPLEELPADPSLICDRIKHPEEISLSDSFSLDLELRAVLQTEGRKLYGLSDQRKEKRKPGTYDRRSVKPFLHTLHMYHFDEEDYITYNFEITRPKNVYSLIEEGYLSVEDYMESIGYVLKTMMPDCIHKKGYDLFGPDQVFYHEFIMEIHGANAEEYLAEARNAGWREPSLDLHKVLRG